MNRHWFYPNYSFSIQEIYRGIRIFLTAVVMIGAGLAVSPAASASENRSMASVTEGRALAPGTDTGTGISADPSGAHSGEIAGKSSTCYEVFVYSFLDSDGDGIGDLKGVTQKLDYICGQGEDSLGCDMIWLMPVFPSPTYHKYDVTDYMDIDPQYGTLEDLEELLAACHEKGVRLILDLPLNHTSTEHPWFRQASACLMGTEDGQEPAAGDCPYLEYYNFSREKQDGWEPLGESGWFYEARFWSGMPDLNLDSPLVRQEIADITAFWQEKGVDGFRLDAVTSYYTESKEESIDFVRWLTGITKEKDPDCYLVGEAWTDRGTYMEYYTSGIDSMFDFSFAGPEGVIAAVTRGSKGASWYGEQLEEEEKMLEQYGSAAVSVSRRKNQEDGSSSVNAPFYTNHDMARSAGYYPDDGGARTKFAWAMNLLMPGNAFLYYGEELGMNGSGRDENKRAPMYWTSDSSAPGMCIGPPEMEPVEMTYPDLEQQQQDSSSVWSCVREAVSLRRQYPAISGGRTDLVEELSGKDICALVRTEEGEQSVLLIFNASETEQQIDLSLLAEDSPAAAVTGKRDILTLTPYAIALTGEGDEEWTLLNEGCVLPEKKRTRNEKRLAQKL